MKTIFNFFKKPTIETEVNNTLKNDILNLEQFFSINNDSLFSVEFSSQYDVPKLSGSPELIQKLKVIVKEGTLYLESNGVSVSNGKVKNILKLPLQSLKSIHNSSVGNVVTEGEVSEKIIQKALGNIHVEKFTGSKIKASSTGNIKIREIETEFLELNSSALGNITVKSGHINTLEVDMSSTGNVRLPSCDSLVLNNKALGNFEIEEISRVADIHLSSTGNVTCQGPCTEKLHVVSKALGNVTINDLDSQEVYVKLSSVGNINLSGTANEVKVVSNGLGNINGKNLFANDTDINQSGLGNCSINNNSGSRKVKI